MPVLTEDDWSDSDEEIDTGTETDVLLGLPDGMVETDSDIKDAAVSRIGGLPAFLPSREPPVSSSQCKVCSNPMELLMQVWCPFEDSPMDRALYVWGCARSTCQRQAGSIRAWRGLRYNPLYAAKLKKRKARNNVPQKTVTSPSVPQVSVNPFSVTVQPMAFGLGDQIFRSPAIDNHDLDYTEEDHNDCRNAESDDSSSSEDSLLTAMASTRVADSCWAVVPSYPAIYLSTLSEYIPQPPEPKVLAKSLIEDPIDADGKSGKDKASIWAAEMYENPLQVDNVFDRFMKRVGFTGEQCLRYELGGIPLPFASDKVFELLFPATTQAPFPITKGDFKVVQPTKRSYSTASIPLCPCCRSSRVFECQLMPNLINVLRTLDDKQSDVQKLTEEQRMKAVQDVVRRSNGSGSRGMEWGTCMVFSCENNCCLDDRGREDKECWREEYVLVQWDE